MWLHMNKEDAGLPLVKTLEAQTELAPAQYQFKHLSFQEGLFAQHLLIQAEAGWSGWATRAHNTASTLYPAHHRIQGYFPVPSAH